MAILTPDELRDLVRAMSESGVDTQQLRRTLLTSVHYALVNNMLVMPLPVPQLMNDLAALNEEERWPDGTVPLAIYLKNAELYFEGRARAIEVIRHSLSEVIRRTSGAPVVATPEAAGPRLEVFIHTDDTVSLPFLQVGLHTARSVTKLVVPKFVDGQPGLINGMPERHLGTGWLLSRDLLMTNHHVVSARREHEPNASAADLMKQAAATSVAWDFDVDGADPGSVTTVVRLELADPVLDYAILRIPAENRPALARSTQPLAVSPQSPVPVNIIQHPFGRAKRFGIRNNLLHAVNGPELRYFTDTEQGSSGSPVLDDRWQVVGLHRAGAPVTNVTFQGKPTAYVNVGSLWTAIAADIRAKNPALAIEIGA